MSVSKGAQLEVARIQSEINRLFEMLMRMRDGGIGSGAWTPGADVAESATHVIIEVDLPGVEPESVELACQGGQIVVRGNRDLSQTRGVDGGEVIHDEREYGSFELSVPLINAVNAHEATAAMDNGVLRIELPKVPERRREAIPIHIEQALVDETR